MNTVESHDRPHGGEPQPQPQPRSFLRHPARVHEHRSTPPRDRRRHQRVKIALAGRFMRADKQEYPCRVINISPGGMAIESDIVGEARERIVVYLEHLGRFEGELVRCFPGGFAIRLTGTSYKREKIANQLTWLVNKNQLDLAEDRQHERFMPTKTHMKITLGDGSERDCRIVDVSLGGASVSVLPKPGVGETVILGLIRGTVVRHHDQGIGIHFLEIQDPGTIERQFS